jgi:hypothetical protein
MRCEDWWGQSLPRVRRRGRDGRPVLFQVRDRDYFQTNKHGEDLSELRFCQPTWKELLQEMQPEDNVVDFFLRNKVIIQSNRQATAVN